MPCAGPGKARLHPHEPRRLGGGDAHGTSANCAGRIPSCTNAAISKTSDSAGACSLGAQMLGIHDFALFVASGLLLNLVPGADFLYVAGRSASQGAKAGSIAALGIAAGCFVHVLTAIVGVSALLAASAQAFMLMKLAGAAYLIWLGLGLLRSAATTVATTAPPSPPASARTIFLQGFVTNALNPKVAVFFLAFLPQFVDPSAPSPSLALLILGLVFNLNGTLWNLCVAFGAAALARKVGGSARVARIAKGTAGALFVVLGCRLATSSR